MATRSSSSTAYSWLYPQVLAISLLGAFANSNNLQDYWLLVGFGVLGWSDRNRRKADLSRQ